MDARRVGQRERRRGRVHHLHVGRQRQLPPPRVRPQGRRPHRPQRHPAHRLGRPAGAVPHVGLRRRRRVRERAVFARRRSLGRPGLGRPVGRGVRLVHERDHAPRQGPDPLGDPRADGRRRGDAGHRPVRTGPPTARPRRSKHFVGRVHRPSRGLTATAQEENHGTPARQASPDLIALALAFVSRWPSPRGGAAAAAVAAAAEVVAAAAAAAAAGCRGGGGGMPRGGGDGGGGGFSRSPGVKQPRGRAHGRRRRWPPAAAVRVRPAAAAVLAARIGGGRPSTRPSRSTGRRQPPGWCRIGPGPRRRRHRQPPGHR